MVPIRQPGRIRLQTIWRRVASKLRDAADRDTAEERRRLQEFTGIGQVGASIFSREVAAAWPTLTAAAAVTDRTMLGTLVASLAFRTPVSLARIAMTVQDISAGRLVLGLGMGSPFCAEAD